MIHELPEGKETFTASELAEIVNVSPKAFRAFIRRNTEKSARPGSGNRYGIPREVAEALLARWATRGATGKVVTLTSLKGDEQDA